MVIDGLPPITTVAMGSSVTLAIDEDGKVWCWGRSGEGQCSRTDGDVTEPVVLSRIEGATRIAAGRTMGCALGREGALWCWGEDRYRRFAGGWAIPSVAIRVDGALGVTPVDLAAGAEDVCVLDDQGTVTCWGSNLGDWNSDPPPSNATPEERHEYFLSWGGPQTRAKDVHAFMEHSYPVCVWEGPADARTWRCLTDKDPWPRAPGAPTGPRRSWPQLSVAGSFGCSAEGGRVQCWGQDDDPRMSPEATDSLEDAVQVAIGGAHACALREGGAVTCWGSALHFSTGDATIAASTAPSPAPPGSAWDPLPLRDISQLEANNSGLPCALVDRGAVRCWDEGRWTTIPGLRGGVELSNGDTHACARRSDGSVRCWGQWYFGPYNHDSDDSDFLTVHTPRRVRIKARAIESWGETDCALALDGSVHCWGRNWGGELRPRRMTEPGPWVDVAMSERWHCGIEHDGHARCFTGASDMKGEPEFELDDVDTIEVTGDRGCALLRDGNVRCWGDGPVGDGTWQDRATPVAVVGLSDAATVSVGTTHTCARTRGGAVMCWGDNDGGQLGDGTTRAALVPVVVAGDLGPLAGVEVVSWRPYRMKAFHDSATVVWNEDGTAWIWGEPVE